MKLLFKRNTFLTLLFLAPCRVVEVQAFEQNAAGVRCSEAALMIDDEKECLEAAQELKGDTFSVKSLTNRGSGFCGCQMGVSGRKGMPVSEKIYFFLNSCAHGDGTNDLNDYAPICRTPAPPAADGGGDPHYSMFSKQHVTVQALCDLNLFSLKNAYGGVQIHSRHSMPLLKKEQKKGYSIISNLAIRIGNDDTWELIANGPTLFRNRIYFDGFEEVHHEKTPAFSPAGGTYDAKDLHGSTLYSVQKVVKGQRKNIVEYVFTFPDNNSDKVVFRGNRHYGMNFVEVHGFASHSVQGFLGRTDKKGFFDRRGKDMMSQEESHLLRGNKDHARFSIELYAQEWQVGLDEMNLFMNKSEYPVAPQKCSFLGKGSIDGLVDSDIVDAGNNPLTIMGEEARPRRKLLEVDEKVVAMAAKACAHLSNDNPKKKFCLEDVMVTEEPELALDSFYEE